MPLMIDLSRVIPVLPLLFVPGLEAFTQELGAGHNWEVYRGGPHAIQFSSLDQINTTNVSELEQAWVHHTGDAGERTMIQCNPLMVDGRLFVTSPNLAVICLDATSGEQIWRFQPGSGNTISGVNRGITWWSNGEDSRILFTAGHELIALDAETGKTITSFGHQGKVDLREDLIYPADRLSIAVTSPGIIYEDLIIMGSATGEGYNASPGHVRAYDVRTGEMIWRFHTIPQPEELGYDTWNWLEGEWYGGTNVWGGLSLDPERGWVFLATGSPSYDFYAANRIGQNLFGNSVIAVDARTGAYVWHYQIVHHDLWDYDLPCAPSLTTVDIDGAPRDVVVQPTKMGYVVVLDRETGEPVFPLDERPVPPSDIPGEKAWPTQPIPRTGFFARWTLQEGDLRDFDTGTGEDPWAEYRKYRYWGPFTPPSLEGSLAMPSTWGGALWGGAAVDPRTETLFINTNELASINRLRPVRTREQVAVLDDRPSGEADLGTGKELYLLNCSACHGADRRGIPPAFPTLTNLSAAYDAEQLRTLLLNGKGAMPAYTHFSEPEMAGLIDYLFTDASQEDALSPPMDNAAQRYVTAGYFKFLDAKGFPFNAPPWGSLNAMDLRTGELKWKVPLGEVEELTRRGIPPTGDRNFGGGIATAGDLVFIAASTDEKIRAFHSSTGEILWEATLPAAGYAVPATYEVEGKQFVVIPAGGGGRGGTPSGDAIVAFTLPTD